MATRAEIIAKAKQELSFIGAGLSSTDTTAGDFYHPLNDALARMGYGDSDVAAFSLNSVRIASIGTCYYVLKMYVKRMISVPRMDVDQISRDKFARTMELLREYEDEFMKALSGEDIPPEISRPAESIVTWSSGSGYGEDQTGASSAGEDRGVTTGDHNIDDLGIDTTDYSDDGY